VTLAVCFLLLGSGAALGQAASPRPTVGVAFGGGSARGLAHIGVIRWFEEHHVPIDVAAGTSMGGLVGGAYATGMSADELGALMAGTDWDAMFGSTSYAFKNVRRKEDARSYPSRLEFGLKGGFVPPTALNNGQQVDLLLARITAPYYGLERFDALPTPFRVVAVDLKTAEKVVIDRGNLATALRATMSLPGVFPPVDREGRVLVDGGALDNVPADVVRDLGASYVIAINVGLPLPEKIDYSMFGLLGHTIDAMMRSSTQASLKSADLTIAVDVTGFGSLDWRRADELIARGYQAAEAHKDVLLTHRLDDADWSAWLAAKEARRRHLLPVPEFLDLAGLEPGDAALVRHTLERHLHRPVDVPLLERDLAALTGLDRYESVTWRMVENAGRAGLLVSASVKPYAPPFLMLGLNVENTTSEDFRVQLAGRYLAFDVLGPATELRIDGGLGVDPTIGASLYVPLARSPVFGRIAAGASSQTFNFIQNDVTVAEYSEARLGLTTDVGVNLSRQSEVSGGFFFGHISDTVRAGDPGLPELSGAETRAHLAWLFDSQDSTVVPSRGIRVEATLDQTLSTPEPTAPEPIEVERTNAHLTQAQLHGSWFTSAGRRNRLFAVLSGGTSFNDHPLPPRQFTVGYPGVLDAFPIGEKRGDHYAVLTLGALRQFGRLPDFIGGPVFIGGWLENGSVFNSAANADINTHAAVAVMVDTLVGPLLVASSTGLDGGWRTIFGIGRIFR
jgi:NTE family protein